MRVRSPLALAAALILAAALAAACTGDMWCENTATGERADEHYCDVGSPGYQWKTSTSTSTGYYRPSGSRPRTGRR